MIRQTTQLMWRLGLCKQAPSDRVAGKNFVAAGLSRRRGFSFYCHPESRLHRLEGSQLPPFLGSCTYNLGLYNLQLTKFGPDPVAGRVSRMPTKRPLQNAAATKMILLNTDN